ncbi:conserved hypothetical protein [Rhodococcus sp. RD6.2]|jgi:hypothetical protein|uniref:hypothetical protein n=1 Tax=Rhodococcus sp. RD6.2 TaxID=260936 RepID=UPI00063B7A05|nr:hypothetical protein [Rhodococcus sp. RD6.2]CRK51838.1 conserved hypothetical protein [Rhodococcus sp. RD6.2]
MTGARWWKQLFGRGKAVALDAERTDLVVVVSSFDDAEACSTALARGAETAPAWNEQDEAVLRHHLRLPGDSVDRAVELAAQDGYVMASDPVDAPRVEVSDGLVAVVLQRTQTLDALHCSQEKSRMAGLAQRAGGTVVGWDALQPPRDAAL